MTGSYIHRGIYDIDGHSHGDSQVPMKSATRCTMIFMSKNMREHAFRIRGAIASHHIQFISVRGVALILCDSSKQHAMIYRNGEISY